MTFLDKAKQGDNRWYLYIFTLLFSFLCTQLADIPLALYATMYAKTSGGGLTGVIPPTNTGLALSLFTFVGGLLAFLICVKRLHKKKMLDVLTGRSRWDGRRCLFGAAIWGGWSLLVMAIQYGFLHPSELEFQFQAGPFWVMCLICLLLFPVQVAFEEFIFRGYLLQGFSLLFKNRWASVAATGIIFGLMHSANPEIERFGFWIAMPQYILMGLLLGYLTVKDNGIELAYGLHLANNFLAALLITHESTALPTHALFRDMNPTNTFGDLLFLIMGGLIFILAYRQKYRL